MMFEEQMQYMSESIVYVKFSKRECRSEQCQLWDHSAFVLKKK